MKKKIILLIVIIFLGIMFVATGTYAFLSWGSNVNKNVVFNTPEGYSDYIVYDAGTSSFVGNLEPTVYFHNSVHTTISFNKTSELADETLWATIYLDINSIGLNISESDDVWWVITDGDGSSFSDEETVGFDNKFVVNYGTFNGVSDGDRITLAKNLEVSTTRSSYTVWIWIDIHGDNISSLSGDTIDTHVWTEINGDNISVPEDPEAYDGLIPVIIDDDGVVTTIAPVSQKWYDYDDQRWANAILVNEDVRDLYSGVHGYGFTVDPDDILAYFVWIPRFKYKIWTKRFSEPQSIGIVFESQDAPISTGTSVGSYRTHPAFWWDYDGDEEIDYVIDDIGNLDGEASEVLAGIWVGKFEVSPAKTSTCYTAQTKAACNVSSGYPYVLPNVKSWRYQTLANQFDVSMEFANGWTCYDCSLYEHYGLTNAYDSHLIKNSEWGAVAYLSHSVYGINDEVRMNNYMNKGTLTGCGAASNTDGTATTCAIPYGSGVSEYPQSTTGNITGIFDMAGGAWEYVMGNYDNILGVTGFTSMPWRSYYDLYSADLFPSDITNTESFLYCPLDVCGGHSLFETHAWYDDYARMPNATYPWIRRGGGYSDAELGGIFQTSQGGDKEYSSITWRPVLVIDGIDEMIG